MEYGQGMVTNEQGEENEENCGQNVCVGFVADTCVGVGFH